MESWLPALTLVAVAFYGGLILERLPKKRTGKTFTWQLATEGVCFRIDRVEENDFEIGLKDDWAVGRSFSLAGEAIPSDSNEGRRLKFRGRQYVTVYPSSNDWFDGSRLGSVTIAGEPRERADLRVVLPYQIARQVLEDLRDNPDQYVAIGIAEDPPRKGRKEVSWGIYRFELRHLHDYL